MNVTADELLAEVKAYCERTGMAPTNFGQQIRAGKGFVSHLRSGTRPKPETVARARRFMSGETAIRTARIELDKIRADLRAQPREDVSAEVVGAYAEDMAAGAQFPPLVVFQEGDVFWLADGFHRYAAARQRGIADITCEVREGGIRDAILCGCGANAAHGLQRGNADKRRAVARMLEDEEWRGWSDREIARQCKVSPDLVGSLRRELAPSVGNDRYERKTQRGGTTYTMSTGRINQDRAALVTPPPEAETTDISSDKGTAAAIAPASESKLDLVLTLLDSLTREELAEVRVAIDLLEEAREGTAA